MSTEVYTPSAAKKFHLSSFVKSLKTIGWIVVVFAVVFALIVFTFSTLTFVPRYRSTVRFTITPLVSSNSSNGASIYNFNYNAGLASQMANTFPHIMNSGILYDIILNDLGHPVNVNITSKAINKTNIFEVTVSSTSAEDAYAVMLLLIKNYPKVAEYVVGDTRMDVIEGSEPELATSPYNTNSRFVYAGAAALLGFALGLLIVYIHSIRHKAINTKNDIEEKLNGDCICEIPFIKKKKSGSKSIARSGPGNTDFSEAFRLLKQRVSSRCRLTDNKVIGITSGSRGEGKTTVAYNLARALSASTSRVLLLDLDLRDRSVQEYLNRKNEVPNLGICDVVEGKAELEACLNAITDNFDVLFAGVEKTEFRKSKFAPLFEQLKALYDYIVVDLSSCDIASETASTADLCDEILFVIKWNNLSSDKIMNAIKYMSFSDAHFMGFVLNQISSDEIIGGKYHYGHYYYSYARRYGYGRYGHRYGYGYGALYGKHHPHRHQPASQLSVSLEKSTEKPAEAAETEQ